ncbi:hypothetical protein [Rhodococcus chondri]|uniref:Transposase n=1 Tax=Rhodococcus chondri TaxID=3065941 RepID=A0ABU7JWT0_9NOCA|nr:hypothetical protein [Rhodococcus sp. CC-R104]MEE2034486.1 hypothetical protein [Rhodococcus sp. CC-R104]
MSEGKREFVALRLDEVIHEWEANAPADDATAGSGKPEGPLVTAQRHRAEIDTASDERVDEIAAAYPQIIEAWESR